MAQSVKPHGTLGICETWNTWKQRLSEWMETDDIRYKLFDMRYTEFRLAEEIKNFMETDRLEEKLWAYAESVISFYKPYYKEKVLEENSVGLPDELQLALELKNSKNIASQETTEKHWKT